MTFRYHELIHMPFLIQLNLHSDNLDLTQRSTGDPSMSLPRTFQMWSVVQVGWRKKLTLEQREVDKNCWLLSLLKKTLPLTTFFLKEFFFGGVKCFQFRALSLLGDIFGMDEGTRFRRRKWPLQNLRGSTLCGMEAFGILPGGGCMNMYEFRL